MMGVCVDKPIQTHHRPTDPAEQPRQGSMAKASAISIFPYTL